MEITGRTFKALASLIPKRDPRKVLLGIHVAPHGDNQTVLEVSDGGIMVRVTVRQGGVDEFLIPAATALDVKIRGRVELSGLTMDGSAVPKSPHVFKPMREIGAYPNVDMLLKPIDVVGVPMTSMNVSAKRVARVMSALTHMETFGNNDICMWRFFGDNWPVQFRCELVDGTLDVLFMPIKLTSVQTTF